MQTPGKLWTGLVLVVLVAGMQAAPAEQEQNLTADEQKEVDRLEGPLDRSAAAGSQRSGGHGCWPI